MYELESINDIVIFSLFVVNFVKDLTK